MQRLKYEKFNNSNDVITINLHNGYTVIAVTGFDAENGAYITPLFLLLVLIILCVLSIPNKLFWIENLAFMNIYLSILFN